MGVADQSFAPGAGSAMRLVAGSAVGIEWKSWGSGPPLVLLHGGFGSWTHWVRNIAVLARSHLVLVPDLPGLGASDDIPADTGTRAIARDVLETLDRIIGQDTPFAIAGFSFGAIIAGRIAEHSGGRVTRLILLGASGLGAHRPPPAAPMTNWRKLEGREAVLAAHRVNLGVHMIHDTEKIDDHAVELQFENTRRARFRSRAIAASAELREALQRATVPIAAIWGECDATAAGHLEERRAILASIDADVEFLVLPKGGHWVQYECAAEVNRQIAHLLNTPRPRHRRELSA